MLILNVRVKTRDFFPPKFVFNDRVEMRDFSCQKYIFQRSFCAFVKCRFFPTKTNLHYTPLNNEPVPQVLKQVVSLSCFSCSFFLSLFLTSLFFSFKRFFPSFFLCFLYDTLIKYCLVFLVLSSFPFFLLPSFFFHTFLSFSLSLLLLWYLVKKMLPHWWIPSLRRIVDSCR